MKRTLILAFTLMFYIFGHAQQGTKLTTKDQEEQALSKEDKAATADTMKQILTALDEIKKVVKDNAENSSTTVAKLTYIALKPVSVLRYFKYDQNKLGAINKDGKQTCPRYYTLSTDANGVCSCVKANVKFVSVVQGEENKTVNIDSVRIITKGDLVSQLKAYFTQDGITRCYTTKGPIMLNENRFDPVSGDLLGIKVLADDGNETWEYIRLGDVLSLDAMKRYVPDDVEHTFTKSGEVLAMKRGTGLNSFLDVRLYTDALALVANKPNGLALFDINVKQPFIRNNFHNHGLMYLHYFRINFNFSKYDSKVGTVLVDSPQFSRSQIMQKSRYNLEFAFNLLDGWIEKKSQNWAYWDAGVGLFSTDIVSKADTASYLSQYAYTELGLDLKVQPTIGIGFNVRGYMQWTPELSLPGSTGRRFFVRPQVAGYWNPENSASKIFFRAMYVMDTEDIAAGFTQIQLGYSINITDIGK